MAYYYDWSTLKRIIKDYRDKDTMECNQSNGNFRIQFGVYLEDLNDWIRVNPQTVDLRSGKAKCFYPGEGFREINLKERLCKDD